MLMDVVEARAAEGYQIWVRFEDGVQGVVDVAKLVAFEGVFAPMRDLTVFRQVSVNPDLGTVVWPNDADLDPNVLYALVTHQTLDGFEGKTGTAESTPELYCS